LSDEIDQLGANDILFVTPAGNTAQNNDDPNTPRYPCDYDRPSEICVAATDQNDQLPSWANYGAQSVDMAAPGDNIYSTLRSSKYGYISGSSMSAAEVSGAAALILSAGDQSVSALKADILNGVDPLPALAGRVRTGGRLDIRKALQLAQGKGLFTYPSDGQANVDTSQAFTWSTIPSAQGYYLTIGTSKGGVDLVDSHALPASQSSYSVPALARAPSRYARLYTTLGGNHNNYPALPFTAAQGEGLFTYPTNGQSNVDTSQAFTWSTIPSAQGYYLTIGTTKGGFDLVDFHALPASQSSYSVPALPTGQTLYARLYTKL